VSIVQEGEATATAMSTFNLVGAQQTLDTHTALRLDHPRATSAQLHKCIVAAATGRGVFDGANSLPQSSRQGCVRPESSISSRAQHVDTSAHHSHALAPTFCLHSGQGGRVGLRCSPSSFPLTRPHTNRRHTGNVKVNRLAQKTDAQQLTRNLLLVKNATVNVKPNLQIVADDVKCTHGCTVRG
jgi:Fe-S cluster assembly scaffold protein SufB